MVQIYYFRRDRDCKFMRKTGIQGEDTINERKVASGYNLKRLHERK
jgi:hypothetical protein